MASRADDASQPEKADDTTAEALKNAADAIERLESSSPSERRSSLVANVVIVVVSVFVGAALIVHTFFEEKAPQVDETTVLLLVALLFAPFVGHLRTLEIGGAKAEWRDDASTGLREVLEVVRHQHAVISRMFAEITDHLTADQEVAREPSEEAVTEVAVPSEPSRPRPDGPLRVLKRILWVDDHPEGNAYELENLRKLFHVTTATSTSTGIKVLDAGRVDAVVSDIIREEGRVLNPAAGARLTEHAISMDPPRPVFIFASEEAVERHGQQLTDLGALIVTASYVDLVKEIRRQARTTFDAIVRSALNLVPNVQITEQLDDLDYLIALPDGRRYAVETPHWLRPPANASLDQRFSKLARAIATHSLSGALLVTQRPLLTPEQQRRSPKGVQVVEVENLADALKNL
jgi:CheY-like chemotaxis protein